MIVGERERIKEICREVVSKKRSVLDVNCNGICCWNCPFERTDGVCYRRPAEEQVEVAKRYLGLDKLDSGEQSEITLLEVLRECYERLDIDREVVEDESVLDQKLMILQQHIDKLEQEEE